MLMRLFYKPATIMIGAPFILAAISMTLILPSGIIFAQQKEIIYNGKPISLAFYLTLSLGDRLTVLSATGNDTSLLPSYLNPLSDDDIDSLAVLAQARIDKLRDVGAELGISPEVIEKQVNA